MLFSRFSILLLHFALIFAQSSSHRDVLFARGGIIRPIGVIHLPCLSLLISKQLFCSRTHIQTVRVRSRMCYFSRLQSSHLRTVDDRRMIKKTMSLFALIYNQEVSFWLLRWHSQAQNKNANNFTALERRLKINAAKPSEKSLLPVRLTMCASFHFRWNFNCFMRRVYEMSRLEVTRSRIHKQTK